ncbi:P-loop containing nucleoside triphosphate hydrolase protein [Xylaria sp. FL0064]|nr:P-loop containing nucleoside triphosphate hydrolase protein [Xylaria sp. FL0064]
MASETTVALSDPDVGVQSIPEDYETTAADRADQIQDYGMPSASIPDQIQDHIIGSVDPEGNVHPEDSIDYTWGMICDKKNIYLGRKSPGLDRLDRHDHDSDSESSEASTADYALVVRYKKSDNPHREQEMFSLEIQSPLLKSFLHDVFHDYPGVLTKLSRLIFYPPFKPFIHRWQRLMEASEKISDEDTKNHVDLLRKVLYEATRDLVPLFEDFRKNLTISYDHVWYLYDPGCLIYTEQHGHPVVMRVVSGAYVKTGEDSHSFQLTCVHVDWDGVQLGYASTFEHIQPFEGIMAITHLPYYPLTIFHLKKKNKKEIINRGRKFEALAGCRHMYYKGKAIYTDPSEGSTKVMTIDDQIMIDCEAHRDQNVHMPMRLKPLHRPKTSARIMTWVRFPVRDTDDEDDWYDDSSAGDEVASADAHGSLSEDHLLLCSPFVRGYALGQKLWLQFSVDGVRDMDFGDFGSIDTLVLSEEQKDIILALAQAHGKKQAKVPLYQVDATDLGMLKGDNQDTMKLLVKWNVILLIDECDRFFEGSTALYSRRNIWRMLEIYEGTILLTTSRPEAIEPWVKSRINYHFGYPVLDTESRKRVWKWLLDRQEPGHEVSDAELTRLAAYEIDGCQIHKAIKGAMDLASYYKAKLRYRFISVLLEHTMFEPEESPKYFPESHQRGRAGRQPPSQLQATKKWQDEQRKNARYRSE